MNTQQLHQWLAEYVPVSEHCYKSPLVMGIVNVTPDSFSDAGQTFTPQSALRHAQNLIAQGADLLDIGGESSRPGALPVLEQEELDRVIPVIEAIRRVSSIALSVDTTKPAVMAAAVAAGASMVNDISALRENNALHLIAALNVPVCLVHMQGTPDTMQENPQYPRPVIEEISAFFEHQIRRCTDAGISAKNLILDPGWGFGKTPAHNLQLLKQARVLTKGDRPWLYGLSRKSTLGAVLHVAAVKDRLIAGIAGEIVAALHGVALLRTHEVDKTKQALTMLNAVYAE